MSEKKKFETDEHKRSRSKMPHWAWPVGLAIAGLGAAATVFLRGCWHSHMSWPIKAEGEHEDEYSYQVCTDCGMKRLFDERSFLAYGPFSIDLHELIALDRLERKRRMEKAHRKAAARAAAQHTTEERGESTEK